MVPAIGTVALVAGRYANVEIRVHLPNPLVDVLVDTQFGQRLCGAPRLAFLFVFVFPGKTEIHRAQNHIKALKNIVLVRSDLRDIFSRERNAL